MTLKDVSAGSVCRIDSVYAEGALRRRLIDLGMLPGTEVLVRRRAPFGDPLEIQLRGFSLSLRRDDAGKVAVTVLKKS